MRAILVMILEKRFNTILRVLLLLVCLCVFTPGYAFNTNFADLFSQSDAAKSGEKNRAAASAKAKYGGKVLSVSKSKKDGEIVYKVKLLLDSGRIKIVRTKGKS